MIKKILNQFGFECGVCQADLPGVGLRVVSVDGPANRPCPDLTPVVLFTAVSLAISLGFYMEGSHARWEWLSGDQINIVTVCLKKDHPGQLQGDLVVGDVKSVTYYIPSFVETLRLLSLPDHDYLRGLNRMLFLTSLLYMWGWWLLFSTWGNRWVAGLMAFLVRGVLWPPGNELWGISSLWTMIPRTLFLALVPWVLWAWCRSGASWAIWLATCAGAGLLSNVHPVSGACLATALILADVAHQWWRGYGRTALARASAGAMMILVGMLPYLLTYRAVAAGVGRVDPAELEMAMRMRIGSIFWYPQRFLAQYLEWKWLCLIGLPWVAIVLLWRSLDRETRSRVLGFLAFSAGCFLVALLPFAVEAVLLRFGIHIRISFQLIRNIKYIIVSIFMMTSLVLVLGYRALRAATPRAPLIAASAGCLVLLLTYLSTAPALDGIPLLSNDISRTLWPAWDGRRPEMNDPRQRALGDVMDWIRRSTPADASFVGPRLIRVATRRAVVHDWGGAGMLIEGDPAAFIMAARREQALRAEPDPDRQAALVQSWGADYWVARETARGLTPVHSVGGWNVYRLSAAQGSAASTQGDGSRRPGGPIP